MTDMDAVKAGAAALCGIESGDEMHCPFHDVYAGPTDDGFAEQFDIPADLELDGTFCLYGWVAAAVLRAAGPVLAQKIEAGRRHIDIPGSDLRSGNALSWAAELVRGKST